VIGFLVGFCVGLWVCYWLMMFIVIRPIERQRDAAWEESSRYLSIIMEESNESNS
jgi:hypothetical protein